MNNADKIIRARLTHFNAQPASAQSHPIPTARERLHRRTCELAVLAGRQPLEVTMADYEQAKQEVASEVPTGRQDNSTAPGQ